MARTSRGAGLVLIAVIAIVAVLACSPAPASVPNTSPASNGAGSSPAPGATTAFDAVVAMLGPNGEVSPEMALQAFSLAVAPIPGVTPPAGAPGQFDADAAVAWVSQVWDELGSTQQTEIEHALGAMPDPFQHRDPAPAYSSDVRLAAWQPETAAAQPSCALYGADPVEAPTDNPPDIQAYLDQMLAAAESLAGHLRRPSLPRLGVCVMPTGILAALALTRVFDGGGARVGLPSSCSIFLDADSIGGVDDGDLGYLMAYQTFRCFEATVDPTEPLAASNARIVPAWIAGGSAAWAGATVAVERFGETGDRVGELWTSYLTETHLSLFRRTNSAIGFFAQVDQNQPSAWDVLDAGLTGVTSTGAFDALTGRRQSFIDLWAAGFFRDARRGADWDIVGPGIPTDTPEAGSIEIENGGSEEMAAPSMAVATADLSTSADVTTFASNHLRIHDGVQDLKNVRNQAYCTRDGGTDACACPEGTPGAARPPLPSLGVEAKLAVTGMEWGATAEIRGLSLEDYCGPQPSTAPVCSVGIPAGDYEGTLHYTTVTPYLKHEGSGEVRVTVDAADKVSGSWDLAYVSTSSTGQMGTGAVNDGIVGGTPRVLALHGSNVVATDHGTGTTVPWPDTPLTVQPVCDGEVIAEYHAGALTVTVHASATTP